MCDSKLRIINAVARYPGSSHDSYIWENSNLAELMRNLHNNGHTDYYLLGKDIDKTIRRYILKDQIFFIQVIVDIHLEHGCLLH